MQMFIGVAIVVFSLFIWCATLRGTWHRAEDYEHPYDDPMVWHVLSIATLIIGVGLIL